ncbi:hypothetical protein Tco_1019030 [Tanacetum coccineum]|uniref:Uncharacterized protein n=1 Tax=Tanacetum coccineum TaxID=301880 RepID=A0ABQ5FW34_9ASTR
MTSKENKDAYKVFVGRSINDFLKTYGTVKECYESFNSRYSNMLLEQWYEVEVLILLEEVSYNLRKKISHEPLLSSTKLNESNKKEKESKGLLVFDDDCKETESSVSRMDVDNELVDNVMVETVKESFAAKNRLVDNVRCDESELKVSKMDDNSNSKEVKKESIESKLLKIQVELKKNGDCVMNFYTKVESGVSEIDDDNQCLDDENTIVGSVAGSNEEQEVGIEVVLKNLKRASLSNLVPASGKIIDGPKGNELDKSNMSPLVDEQKEIIVWGNKMFPNEVCGQKGFYTFRRCHDIWNEQGWEDEDKDLIMFSNDSSVHDLYTKVLSSTKPEFSVNESFEPDMGADKSKHDMKTKGWEYVEFDTDEFKYKICKVVAYASYVNSHFDKTFTYDDQWNDVVLQLEIALAHEHGIFRSLLKTFRKTFAFTYEDEVFGRRWNVLLKISTNIKGVCFNLMRKEGAS